MESCPNVNQIQVSVVVEVGCQSWAVEGFDFESIGALNISLPFPRRI